MKNFIKLTCTIVAAIGLAWMARANHDADRFSETIEATELWFDPWPLPAAPNGMSPKEEVQHAHVPATASGAGALSGDRRAAF
jgi:hypothetical protein